MKKGLIKIKRKTVVFFKSLYLSSVILLCIFFGIYGVCRAYEEIRKTGFGEYRKAVEIEEDGIKILDFEF